MKQFKISFYILSIIVCFILILFALYMFPIPGSDSIVFIPGALFYSKGYGLMNPLYYVTKITDLTHTDRFNYYVPFYTYLLGILSKVNPGIKTIFFICALFSSACLLLYARCVNSFVSNPVSNLLKATILLSATYIASYLLPTVGRPENFTRLFVLIVYLLYLGRNKVNKTVYTSVLIALFAMLLTSQLISFFFCFLFYVLYEIINAENIYKNILKNILVGLAVVGLSCLIIECSPNGLANTITGIKLHIDYVFKRTDSSLPLLIQYWVYANLNFGFIAIFLLSAFFFLKEIYARLKGAGKPKIATVSLILLFAVYGIIKFILYAAPTVYNATTFILPLSAYIIYNILQTTRAATRNILTALTLITFMAGTFVFVRSIILFVVTQQSGKDFETAKVVMHNYTKNNKHIYITNGLWTLFDRMDNVKMFGQDLGDDLYKPGDTVIFQQAYRDVPKHFTDRATLLLDWSAPEPVKFMGIKLSNHPLGYSFMVYKYK